MSFAAARQALSSTARASLRRMPAFRAGARRMNSSQAGSKPKSDRPWTIASALIFGPAFLWLLSPSTHQKAKHLHHDAHDYPGHDPKSIAKAHAPTPVAAGALRPEPVPVAVPPTSSAAEQAGENGRQAERGSSESQSGSSEGGSSEGGSSGGSEPSGIRMKDDEGKEVDVSATIQKEEAEDVPKASGAPAPGKEPEPLEPTVEEKGTSLEESTETAPQESEEKSS
ncbi:hypothetical protein LshimejAT787_0500800 [Lyophyllum shimeji]|uniref:Uncharacterized protein n=1 Tax=Lyophyllum shimeji TaxID=47721 RepID=A0A9P3UNS9_LYOSH|nr:hypothetical protein LshimejAT787_0500800 [Lyophyllum shimeji]